jgi:hypothetical protein
MKTLTLSDLETQVNTTRRQRAGQLERARRVLAEHPDAVLLEVPDERSGRAFGDRAIRRGQCVKLGGARQPRWYQLWASWAHRDTNVVDI